MPETIGLRLRFPLDRWHLSPDALATRTGVDVRTIRQVESGDVEPDSVAVWKLSEALCVRPEWLQDGDSDVEHGQMLRNLEAFGLEEVQHARSIEHLNQLLRDDYRGIIVTMIHKFRNMPAKINERRNIYVLIDEAHRTTGGDLGTFLLAGLPNASFKRQFRTPERNPLYSVTLTE